MSDQPPRPSWAATQPTAPPASEPPAEPEAPPHTPTWDSLPALARRVFDLKLVIAVLIGLVSVTGAVVAWQSSLAGEKATDKDRQAIAESVIVAQAEADADVIVQDARVRFADHTAATVAAGLLEEQADRFASGGDQDAARAAADEAVEQRALARRALEGSDAPVLLSDYVVAGEGSAPPTFDEGRLRDDLERIANDSNQVDPSQTVIEARRLRADGQRLDGWLIPMVGAVLVLTLAQISRAGALRIGLAAAGTAIWLGSTVIAFGGR